jgi:RNA polymerase sigma-70 factor, Bacteroides expansion family 1
MNEHSFSEIYQQNYKSSFLFVMSYVRDSMVAEDIASESLIRLWQIMTNETVDNPQALLLKILKNYALNYLRHVGIRQSAEEFISSKMVRDLHYRITSLEACDPQEIFSREITSIVEKSLNTLPEQTRRIFEMSRYGSKSLKEISLELSISTKSVEYHITKSLKALRIALKEYLPIFYFIFMQ